MTFLPPARAPTAPPEVAGAVLLATGVAAALPSSAVAADAVPASSGDWFDPVVSLIAWLIDGLDSVVGSAGLSIVLFTILVKAVTFPLNQAALRSSALLQLLQPQVQQIELENKNDDERKRSLLKKLYESVGLNPLSALLPILLQLPIFIALFRAIGRLASQDPHFKEPFLWIPSLAGPVESGRPSLDWLWKTQSADHFEPLVGWHDAQMYLILPVIVVFSQFINGKASSTKEEDGWIQLVFPVFIGITTLVSPAGLGVYWSLNNFLSTGQMVLVQQMVAAEFPELKRVKEEAAKDPTQSLRYTRQSPFQQENAAVAQSVAKLEEPEVAKASSRKARRAQAKSDK